MTIIFKPATAERHVWKFSAVLT